MDTSTTIVRRAGLDPRVVPGVGREVVSAVLTAAAWPFGVIDRGLASAGAALRGEPTPVDAPVLLVHGYAANKSNWLFVQRYLRHAGFDHVHAANCNPFRHDIPELAVTVRDRARALMQRAGTDHVHLVGHSMGGIVARWAVQVAGLHEARTCVTVAAPHGGSAVARLGIGRVASQLRPGSPVLGHLDGAPVPADTRFVAYWSELDALVSPGRARIRDPRLGATNVRVPGEGHLSIMLSRRLADSVVTQLAASEGRPGFGEPVEPMARHRPRPPEGGAAVAGSG